MWWTARLTILGLLVVAAGPASPWAQTMEQHGWSFSGSKVPLFSERGERLKPEPASSLVPSSIEVLAADDGAGNARLALADGRIVLVKRSSLSMGAECRRVSAGPAPVAGNVRSTASMGVDGNGVCR